MMILVNNPGNWDYLFPGLDHAKWFGCTPTDLIFPFFLFAMGNALAFVSKKMEDVNNRIFFKKTIKRSLLIFLIGLLLNWCPFFRYDTDGHLIFKTWTWMNDQGSLTGIRIMGVLQRIALCYLFSAIIVRFFSLKIIGWIGVGFLLIYWWIAYKFGTGQNPYDISGYFGIKLDRSILGPAHMYYGEGIAFDPEGLGSTLPAIVVTLGGYMLGRYTQENDLNRKFLVKVFGSGIILIIVSLLWNVLFPYSKKIWSSSFSLLSTGYALLLSGLLIFLLEVKHYRSMTDQCFVVFGKNPLFIFVLSGFIPRATGLIRIGQGKGNPTVSPLGWCYEHIFKNIAQDLRIGSLLYAIVLLGIYYLICYVLDKKKIYINV